MHNIQYQPGTQSGSFSQQELEKFKRQMRVDMNDFEFDETYIHFIKSNNGGAPIQKYFELADENWFSIERFLNFTDPSVSSPSDVLFNVQQNWNMIEDRLRAGMFPFASLPGGDYLLFECISGRRPRVVLWNHEKSEDGNPCLRMVAPDFDTFISQLCTRPN